jgi:lipopolysaccharide export LptBFGC system permease protein LptF
MDVLRGQYTRQLSEYDRLVNQALLSNNLQQLPRIRELNVAIGGTLDKMITELTFLKRNTPTLASERNQLTQRLREIQKEYNALVANRDQLETLRRIRQQESTEANRQLYWYLALFFGAIVVMLLMMLFFSSYKNETTAPIASTPPMTAALV